MKISLLKCGVFLYFFLLSFSNLFANCPDIFENISSENLKEHDLSSWVRVKANNFNHEYFSSQSRRNHQYLNAILDRILESNAAIISEVSGMSISDLVILIEEEITKNSAGELIRESSGYATIRGKNAGEILIQLGTNREDFQYVIRDNDAMIAAILSHEIIHIVKRHVEREKTDLSRALQKAIDEHRSLGLKELEDLQLSFQRVSELEADELGFKFYVNAGYPIEEYKKWFLRYMDLNFQQKVEMIANMRKASGQKYSIEEALILISNYYQYQGAAPWTYNSKRCLAEGEAAFKSGKGIYIGNDPHPNLCWRYWNIKQKEQELLVKKASDNSEGTKKDAVTLYFKVDLTNSSQLENIREYLSQQGQNTSLVQTSLYNMIMAEVLANEELFNLSLTRYKTNTCKGLKVIEYLSNSNIVYVRANDVFVDSLSGANDKILNSDK